MNSIARFITAAAFVVALACMIYLTKPVRPPTPQPPALHPPSVSAAPPATPRPQVDPDRPALHPLDPPSVAVPRSPLADKLNAPGTSPTQDLAIVFNLLTHYRERYGGFPTGENNAAFVNALAGNNLLRLAFIERRHPAINARGELLDRWGTPFFFHLQSRDSLEVRSAGPDRQFYTADDLITGSHASVSL